MLSNENQSYNLTLFFKTDYVGSLDDQYGIKAGAKFKWRAQRAKERATDFVPTSSVLIHADD